MRVLVLGGTGHLGTRLCALMQASDWATPVCTSRRNRANALRLDTLDEVALTAALGQVDAVVNCVAGSAPAIALGAQVLARACRAARMPRVVHLSSMAVYGDREGVFNEAAPLLPARAWYARAKQDAELAMRELAAAGGTVAVLRPGCVWGPGSTLWVERIAQWLTAGRLGELGERGDGWTNGVHIDDVCRAALNALRLPLDPGSVHVWNLAAPDSPRWNAYFADLAMAIGAPLRHIPPLRLQLDARLAGPILHTARRIGSEGAAQWPFPITPQLLGLWARELKMESAAATTQLALSWTPYESAVRQGAAWWLAHRADVSRARFA